MTAADPRDGLPELPECFTSVHIAGGNHAVYSNGQMHEMYRRGKADALAHARPEAVEEAAALALFTEYRAAHLPCCEVRPKSSPHPGARAMKMTDAELDALVEQIIDRAGRESSADGMDGDRWDRILVRAALTARLAADQQKGGGEADISDAVDDPNGTCPTCYQSLHAGTQQPSSTAPAQQGVDQAAHCEVLRGLFEKWAVRRYSCELTRWEDSGRYRDEYTQSWWECWQQGHGAALANPPHADHKEPQG